MASLAHSERFYGMCLARGTRDFVNLWIAGGELEAGGLN